MIVAPVLVTSKSEAARGSQNECHDEGFPNVAAQDMCHLYPSLLSIRTMPNCQTDGLLSVLLRVMVLPGSWFVFAVSNCQCRRPPPGMPTASNVPQDDAMSITQNDEFSTDSGYYLHCWTKIEG